MKWFKRVAITSAFSLFASVAAVHAVAAVLDAAVAGGDAHLGAEVEVLAHLHITQHLRVDGQIGTECRQGLAGQAHRSQYLQRRHNRIASRMLVEAEQMTRAFATKLPAILLEQFEHIARPWRRSRAQA